MLEVVGISKSYSGQTALHDVDLVVEKGEIVYLKGPNGAGKSTLARILAGIESQDAGSVKISGNPLPKGDPKAARIAGIWLVPQEASLVPSLDALDNVILLLHRTIGAKRPRSSLRRMLRPRIESLLEVLKIEIEPTLPVEKGPREWEHQILLVAALIADPSVLVLDETISSLPVHSLRPLFEMLHDRASKGFSAIVISHASELVTPFCTRVVALDHGRIVAGADSSEAEEGFGGDLAESAPQTESSVSSEDLLLEVSDISLTAYSTRLAVLKLDEFSVRSKEVVGLTGEGATLLIKAIMQDPEIEVLSGQIKTKGSISAVPRSYDRSALFPDLSVLENIRLLSKKPIDRSEQRYIRWKSALGLACDDEVLAGSLSGGNRQKVSILGALLADTDLIILEEPFSSLDAKATRELGKTLDEVARSGRAVIVASEDTVFLERTCSRVVSTRLGEASAGEK